MITTLPCVLVAHDPSPEARTACRQELGSGCELLFRPDLASAEWDAARVRARALIALNPRDRDHGRRCSQRCRRSASCSSCPQASITYPCISSPRDLPIASNAGAYAGQMAEFVLAITLAAVKRLPVEHQEMREGRFNQFVANKTLKGAACAILGFGGVGRATARLFRALGAEIHAINRSGETDEEVHSSAPWRRWKMCSAAPISSSSRCP